MRNSWAFHIGAPILSAALLVGCDGSDGVNSERRAQGTMTNRPENQQAQATVALTGCVEKGSGSDQYVLRNVRFAEETSDSQHNMTADGAHGIAEGSLVRLDAGRDQFASFAGQQVTMTGIVSDDGGDTVGTSGISGAPTTSDRSQAAADKDHAEKVQDGTGPIARDSMAKVDAAEVEVTAMEASGERCGSVRK